MKTPISDFVKNYAEDKKIRLHMPGHKGVGDAEACDITEIDGADVLYAARGIIMESEENAAALFGAGRTVYSAEGSSLSIRAALYLSLIYAREKGIPPLIFAGRNAHKAFLSAAALLDIEVKWLYGEDEEMLSCTLTAADIEKAFSSGAKPAALYITSPDYLGNISDISGISRVCKKYGVLLIVDNAHGAYLRFLEESAHPMDRGADICCDSAHKTLPVLTGGGYLHIAKTAPECLFSMCDYAMSLFASTSPSYLILESLDKVNPYLSEGYKAELHRLCGRISDMKSRLVGAGYSLIGNEPTKLTVAPKSYGYTGSELAGYLKEKGIICEFYDRDFCTMMFTPQISAEETYLTEKALLALQKKTEISEKPPKSSQKTAVLGIREAVMSPSVLLPVEDAVGKILAQTAVTCPPAIPIAVSGELFDENSANLCKYYGVTAVRVIK